MSTIRSRLIAHHHLEDAKPGPACRPHVRAEHFTMHRCPVARPEGRDLREPPAILVPDRKPAQQILDGQQADLLEIGRPPRADAFQKLQGRAEDIGGHT
jgi:hypothetical protein